MSSESPSTPHPETETSASPKRRQRSWRKRLAIIAVVLFAGYTLFGFFAVPFLVRTIGVNLIEKQFHGTALIDSATFNPFTLRLTLTDFRLDDETGRTIIAFRGFDGQLRFWRTVFTRGYHFGHAILDQPTGLLVRERDGRFNLVRMLRESETSEPREPLKDIPRLVIDELALREASLTFQDHALLQPFEKSVTRLDISIANLDTRPDFENAHELRAEFADGAEIAWRGTFFVDPLTSRGRLTLKDLGLPVFMPYAELFTNADVADGRLSVELEYDFAPLRTPRRAIVRLNHVALDDLTIRLDGEELAILPRIELHDISADAAAQELIVRQAVVTEPTLHMRRDDAGRWQIDALLRLAPIVSSDDPDSPLLTSTRGDDRTVAETSDGDAAARESVIEYPLVRLMQAVERLLAESFGPWTVEVESLQLSEAVLHLVDDSPRRAVAITLNNADILAGPVRSREGYRTPFSVRVNHAAGGVIGLEGDIAMDERALSARVKVESLNLATFAPYLPTELSAELPPADLASARVSLDGQVTITAAGETELIGAWRGTVMLDDVRFIEHGSDRTLVEAASIVLDGEADARVDEAGSAARLRWSGLVSIRDADLAIPDQRYGLGEARLTGELDLALNEEGTLAAGWSGQTELGQIEFAHPQLRGTLDALRASGELIVAGTDAITLTWKGNTTSHSGVFSGNLAGAFSAGLEQLHTTGQARLTLAESADPVIEYVGDLRGTRLSAALPDHFAFDGSMGVVEVNGIDLNTRHERIAVRDVSVGHPSISIDFALLPIESDAAQTVASESSREPIAARLPFSFTIGAVTVRDGAISIHDRQAVPPTSIVLEDLSLDAGNLVNDGRSTAEITLSTRIQSTGSASVTGRADLFRAQPSVDLILGLTNLPLKPYDPIAGHYVGYLVDQGRLTMTLPFTIEENRLRGRLNAQLTRFHLGEKVASPVAPNVPIKLGLDLLRDSNDLIRAEIPISGNLDDPRFSIGGVVFQAFVNLIVGGATAPFRLLASLFSERDDLDLAVIAFDPGSAQPSAEDVIKLDVLGQALSERPALQLGMTGYVDIELDTPALKRRLLDEELLAELRRHDPAVTIMSAGPRAAAIERLFSARYPERLPVRVPVPPGSPNQPTLSLENMETTLYDDIVVPEAVFASLALQRAERIRQLLISERQIAPERLRIVEAASAGKVEGSGPRVGLELY